MKWGHQEYQGLWKKGTPNGEGQLIWNDEKSDKKLLKNRYHG